LLVGGLRHGTLKDAFNIGLRCDARVGKAAGIR
jgi:hypothetical protein